MKIIPNILVGLVIFLLIFGGGWLIFGRGFFSADNNQSISVSPSSSELVSIPVRIVAFGDSLTAGYNLSLQEGYPAQLEQYLRDRGYAVEVINAGVSGETSAGGVRRIDFVLSLEPDIILIGLGGNDALRFLPPEEFEQNLRTILQGLLINEKTTILMLGMRAPGNADRIYRERFDAVYPRLAAEFRVSLVPFFLEGIALDPRYTLSDGIHPTSEGYAIMVNTLIGPAVERILLERNIE